jgi:uncharacterized membrane protein YeaQ/YmgE (transglycosylase-associated protein family)
MSLLDFLLLFLIACVCGSIAQALAGYSAGGCLVSVALGFIGALLGTWMARALSLPEILTIRIGDTAFPVVWSIMGGALFAAVLGLLARPRRGRIL